MICLRRVAVASLVCLAAVIALAPPASAGGGCHTVLDAAIPNEARGTSVDLKEACVFPMVLHVDRGATVTFTNRDTFMHNLYGAGIAVDNVFPNEAVTATYSNAGTFPFACMIHVGMVGAIVVDGGVNPAATQVTVEPPPPTIQADTRPASNVRSDTHSLTAPFAALFVAAVALAGLAGTWAVRRRVTARVVS